VTEVQDRPPANHAAVVRFALAHRVPSQPPPPPTNDHVPTPYRPNAGRSTAWRRPASATLPPHPGPTHRTRRPANLGRKPGQLGLPDHLLAAHLHPLVLVHHPHLSPRTRVSPRTTDAEPNCWVGRHAGGPAAPRRLPRSRTVPFQGTEEAVHRVSAGADERPKVAPSADRLFGRSVNRWPRPSMAAMLWRLPMCAATC
jgi:hypothetical protein